MAMHLKTACKKNSKQKQHTIRMKETKLEQETKSGAGESTETRRIPQRRVPRQRERVRPTEGR